MEEKVLRTVYHVCTEDELSAEQRSLVEEAKHMIKKSYCPYSQFHVGAAVRLADGTIVRGANQENAAYPSGLCAERTALFAAGANYPDQKVECLAVACFNHGAFTDEPGSPCGSCRQVMVETEHRYSGKMQIILYGRTQCYVFDSAQDLLPLCFLSENME